jgi:alanyl aminopeptidase
MRHTFAAIGLMTTISMFAGCETDDEMHDRSGDNADSAADCENLSMVAPSGKLPPGARPSAYRLALKLDPRRDDFSGEVSIAVMLDASTDRIWLHGKDLDVSDVNVTTETGAVLSGNYKQVLASGVSAICLDEELPAGNVTLNLSYSAKFDRNLAGLFKVEEQGDAYVLAKSESVQARSYLPGFDEPGLKATFDITLAIPLAHEAIGNSPVIEKHAIGNDMQQLTFATTPPMSTYLLSLAVGPFDIVEREPIPPNDIRSRPVPLRGVARKGRGSDMKYVLDITPRMIEIFEQELQQAYPFEKLDIIAAPQWPSGATELSAAITYREQMILVGDNPPPGARLSLLGLHAHEIAHMWFGNLVTPPWWDDLWLKEGFATWATPLVLKILEPDGGHDLDAAQRSLHAMQLDSLASTRAVREPIADNDQIRNAYDAITYLKSLAVINMVDQFFGPDTFRPALGRYIETFSDGVADSPDFYQVIGAETSTPALTETFRGFVEQTGVPLLEAVRNCEADDKPSLTIRQSRYKALGSPIDDSAKTWSIPVCVRSNKASQCGMMTEAEQTLPLTDEECPQWVLPNASGTGYYRWTLENAGWVALIDSFDQLTPVEALSAVDSAFAAFEAGKLDESILLNIVVASSRVRARQVITAPLPYLHKYVSQHFSTAEKTNFLEFARGLYQAIIERSASGMDEDAQLLHSQLVSFMALTALDPDSRNRLRGMAQSFTGFERARDDDAMPSDLYYPAIAVAIQDAGDDFLHHVIEFRRELDDPRFEDASANAIGHVNNPDLLEVVHELALGEQLGPRETFGMMRTALSDSALRDQHWNWLQHNFPAIVDKIPTQWRRRTPSMAANFCDPVKRAELEDLFEDHADLVAGYQRSLHQAEETIGLCIALEDQVKQLADAISALRDAVELPF